MINVLDSRNLRTSSTTQDLFNDLAPILKTKWSSMRIVYDGTNVSQIWLSDEIYLSISSNSVVITHDTLGFTSSRTIVQSNVYKIVETDSAVMIQEYAGNNWNTSNVIGETNNPTDGTSSYGIAVMINATSTAAFTDNMYANAYTALQNNYASAPQYNEQVVPFVPWYSKDLFPNVYMVTARKATTNEKTLLNGTDYFYVCGALAVKYTP